MTQSKSSELFRRLDLYRSSLMNEIKDLKLNLSNLEVKTNNYKSQSDLSDERHQGEIKRLDQARKDLKDLVLDLLDSIRTNFKELGDTRNKTIFDRIKPIEDKLKEFDRNLEEITRQNQKQFGMINKNNSCVIDLHNQHLNERLISLNKKVSEIENRIQNIENKIRIVTLFELLFGRSPKWLIWFSIWSVLGVVGLIGVIQLIQWLGG